MFSGRTYPRVLLLASVLEVFVLAAGCGGGDKNKGGDGDAQAGESNEAGATSTQGSGGRDDEGSGGLTGNDTGGNTQIGAAGSEPGTTTPAPEFEGPDLGGLSLEPTPGCNGGYDPDTGSLSLQIEESSHSLLLDATDGNLRANGFVCTDADGNAPMVGDVQQLVITGTSTDDTLVFDLLPGSFGDALLGTEGSITVDLGKGSDQVIVRGTRDNDTLACRGVTDSSDNGLDLGGGKYDVALSNAESLLVSMGPGADKFTGASDKVMCSLPLVIYGGADADWLQGGGADDELNGGDGPDEFHMSPSQDGMDVYNGGQDDDLASYAERSKPLSIKLCIAPDSTGCAADTCDCQPTSGEDGEKDTLVNVESADGGSGDDTIIGDDLPNFLSGGSGSDHIQGLGGDDQIDGDIGDDIIEGGAGDDLITARQGHDTVDCGDGGGDICLYIKGTTVSKNCETADQVD